MWIFLWTFLGYATLITSFLSFNRLPLGTAYFSFHAGLLTSGIVAGWLCFGDVFTVRKMIAIALSLLGFVLVCRIQIDAANFTIILLAALSGVFGGLWNLSSKNLSDTYTPLQLVVIDASLASLVYFALAILHRESFPVPAWDISWLGVALNALGQMVATFAVVYGFRRLGAQVGSIIMPMEIVFGTLSGYVFYGEILPAMSLIGGGLIILAALLPHITLGRVSEVVPTD